MSGTFTEIHELASIEDIHITGTSARDDSDFANWLADIDLRADVVDARINLELSEISGSDFKDLSPQHLSRLVKEALAEIELRDDSTLAGATDKLAPNTTTLTPSDKMEIT